MEDVWDCTDDTLRIAHPCSQLLHGLSRGWFAKHALPYTDESWQRHPTKSRLEGLLYLGDNKGRMHIQYPGPCGAHEGSPSTSLSLGRSTMLGCPSRPAGCCVHLMALLMCLASVVWAAGHSVLPPHGWLDFLYKPVPRGQTPLYKY